MSVVQYNPMTGQRLDLVVDPEDAGVAEKRWNEKRRAYLELLVQQAGLSATARESYIRELQELRR